MRKEEFNAAAKVAEIYFNIAAELIGEDEVRRRRDKILGNISNPVEAVVKPANGEHECKYCGCLTDQPDKECYKNPLFGEIAEKLKEKEIFYTSNFTGIHANDNVYPTGNIQLKDALEILDEYVSRLSV